MIRKLRLERGWSQEQLAQLSGLNPRTIQRLESGQTPGLESLKSLAAVFEIDISQLSAKAQQEHQMDNIFTTSTDTVNAAQSNSAHPNKELRLQLLGLFAGYLLMVAMLWVSNLMTYPQYWWAAFPTVSLAFPVLYIAITGVLPNKTGKPTLLESLFTLSTKQRVKKN